MGCLIVGVGVPLTFWPAFGALLLNSDIRALLYYYIFVLSCFVVDSWMTAIL